MPDRAIKISFCSTCKGRLWQLRQTLSYNFSNIGPDDEIVLVDFQSSDGLSEWVWQNFQGEIAAGRLRFFEVLDEAPWHAAKAKNLAHRLGRGELLFNLDVDNFVSPEDCQSIRAALAREMNCRQGTGNLSDGTPGRIGILRAAFYQIGGFDEGLLGVLVEDYDLIVRAEAAGHRFLRLPPPSKLPVQNELATRHSEYLVTRPPMAGDMARLGGANMALQKLKLEFEGPFRHQNFASYRGKLNGEEVILDGFGNLTTVE